MSPEEKVLALKAASDSLGYEAIELFVENALATHADETTESLVDLLSAKIDAFKKSGGRRIGWDTEIQDLKIVLAVRAAVPGIGIGDEIQMNTHRWNTREAPTLTVSLDCLARILAEEGNIGDEDLTHLMIIFCECALPAFHGDGMLAQREARRYRAKVGLPNPEDDEDEA
jgi:hypothetical protein